MKSRFSRWPRPPSLLAIGALAAPAAHAATGVVISQAAFGGSGGGNDEVIEIRNVSAATVDIGGWTLWGSNSSAAPPALRATVPAGTTLPAGKTFVFANSRGRVHRAGRRDSTAPASSTPAASRSATAPAR